MPIDITLPARTENSPVARDAVRYARDLHRYCLDATTTSNIRTNPMSANWVKQTIDKCRDVIRAVNTAAADPNAVADIAYFFEATIPEVDQKFQALRNSAVQIRDWCNNALPRDIDGNLLLEKRDAQGEQTVHRFEIGTMNALADLFDAYIAAAKG